MTKMMLLLAGLTISMTAVAKDKTNKTGRKPAETHGGVNRSNTQFKAVTAWALEEGSSIDRVFSVKKRIDCPSQPDAIYEVQFGSADSNGEEHLGAKKFVVVGSAGDLNDDPAPKITEYTGHSCK